MQVFPHLVGLRRKKENREGLLEARVVMAEFKFKFEFFKLSLKIKLG
jgi:hypothetical protein